MRLKTVGVLAALGMLGTSASVWSFTAQAARSPKVSPEITLTTPPPAVAVEASFRAEGLLTLEARLGQAKVRADAPGEALLLASVGAKSDAGAAAAPLNLAVVIDRSGSMKGKRLKNALDAARAMVRRLRDGDVLSVVAYAATTETIVPSTSIDSASRERALQAIDGIRANGETCISCGIDAAMAALRARSGMLMRILLLSDGEATSGVRDIEGFRRIAGNARSMNCAISSIGVDTEYNERVLAALALDSNGQHYFAETANELQRAFDRELASLVKTVARDAEIELKLAPGVEVEKVFDRSFRQDGNRVFVSMGAFSQGENKTLLVKLRLPKGPEGEIRVADVALKSLDSATGSRLESSGQLSATRTLASIDPNLDPAVSARLNRTGTADAIEAANQLFNSGDAEGARKRLQQKIDEVDRAKKTAEAQGARGGAVSGDFKRQAEELNKADERLEKAPAAAKPGQAPSDTQAGKSGVRRNMEMANPFRL
ncbi:MAG: VWA domain-containing protein [Myxococcales bacterium]|nr:VWA domain-containing protein [Myxococcales bacterium]